MSQEPNHQILFSGIVVTYNEERYLHECFNSLKFCEELIVIDLGSTDKSTNIAIQYGAICINHERVLDAELFRQKAIGYARNDWVVFLDPDEILPVGIEVDLRVLINSKSNLASIKVPWQFYFMGKVLRCTHWGKKQEKEIVFHKKRVIFSGHVHQEAELLKGYTSDKICRRSADYYIKHYWVDSYFKLFEKHWRYIKLEGSARYNTDQRFSWRAALKNTEKVLKDNLISDNGLRGGFNGIFLSLFYSWYIFMGWLSLRKYERHQRSFQKVAKTSDPH